MTKAIKEPFRCIKVEIIIKKKKYRSKRLKFGFYETMVLK